jgi:glycosyltransferase involved in cell wall biosynthesis
MRILQVNSATRIGGGETHVLQLADALRRRGHSVSIAGRARSPLNPDITLPFLNSADVLTAFQLRQAIQSARFEIVHAHVARDYPIVAAAALGLNDVKVIFTRHLLYSVRRNPIYRRVDGWIAPTAEILKTLAPLRPKRSAVIPNWIDLEKFPFRPHSFHHPVTVGLIGQISPHKGHDDAIEAIRLLGSAFRLIIAGEGEPAYVAKLREKSASLPVDFEGFIRLPEFFEKVDIVIVPSWDEPFGIVTLEAMASGIPVIGTGPEGVLCGVKVPPRDPRALSGAIRSITPGGLVEQARAHVESNFEMTSVIDQIETFYNHRDTKPQRKH